MCVGVLVLGIGACWAVLDPLLSHHYAPPETPPPVEGKHVLLRLLFSLIPPLSPQPLLTPSPSISLLLPLYHDQLIVLVLILLIGWIRLEPFGCVRSSRPAALSNHDIRFYCRQRLSLYQFNRKTGRQSMCREGWDVIQLFNYCGFLFVFWFNVS